MPLVLVRREDRQCFVVVARRWKRVVDIVGSVQDQRRFESFEECVGRIGAQGNALLLVALQNHIFGVVTCRDIVFHSLGAAAGAQVHLKGLPRIEIEFMPSGIGCGVAVIFAVLIGKG